MLLQAHRSILTILLMLTALCAGMPLSLSAAWQSPPQFFAEGGGIAVGSDANGHGLAVFGDTLSNQVESSYYSSGVWGAAQVIATGGVDAIDVAVQPDGTALAIWCDLVAGSINTAFFDGSSWSTPNPNPLDSVNPASNANNVAIAMNGQNQGVAIWIDSVPALVRSSFYFNGNWSAPITIGTGLSDPKVGYSEDGTAVAGWFNGNASVANYFGNVWHPQIVLDATAGSGAQVGIDSSGNALAVWQDFTGVIFSSRFTGSSWGPFINVSLSVGNGLPRLGVAPSGTAVAIWVTSAFTGQSSSFNGTLWSAPIPFGTGGPIALNSLSVNDHGNALAVWHTFSEIRSARLPLAGVWTQQEVVSPPPLSGGVIIPIDSSLSSDGTGFAVWGIGGDAPTRLFGAATLAPADPTDFRASVCKSSFATQTDNIIVLSWNASAGPNVVSYNLSRDGILIAVIPADEPFIYYDHNRCKNRFYTYSLTAVDSDGIESEPETITIRI